MAVETMNVKIKLRNDTKTNLENSTLILAQGEIAIVVDSTDTANNGRFKVGDGTKTFSQLPWADAASLKEAVTSLNNLKGAVTISQGDGIVLETTGNDIKIKNNGVRSVTAGKSGYGTININNSSTDLQVHNYGVFDGKIILKDSGSGRNIVITIPTFSTGNDIPIELHTPKDLTAGATIAYTEDIDKAITDNKVSVKSGTGITVAESSDKKTYTVTNDGVTKITAGDSYIGVSKNTGEVSITNKSTLEKGTSLGSVKLNGGDDVVVNDYGTFKDTIIFQKSGTTKTATLNAPNWTPEDTGVGAEIYLPTTGGTLARIEDIPASTKETVVSAGAGISVAADTTTSTKNTYTVTNTGVRSITTGNGDNGTISVNTNGTTSSVSVKGYGTFTNNITIVKGDKQADLQISDDSTFTNKVFYLPSDSTGSTLATTTDVSNVNNSLSQKITTNTNNITEINNKIPSNASSTNKLVTNTDLTNAIAGIHNWTYQVVSSLPTASKDTMYIIYLVAHTHSDTPDSYDEFITIESGTTTKTYTWEKIGNTDVDLSNYYTKTETDNAFVKKVTGKSLIDTDFATGINIMGNTAGTSSAGTKLVLVASPSTTTGNHIWTEINLDEYALKTSIKDPANYYWANIKVSSSSSTTTTPTFGSMKLGSYTTLRESQYSSLTSNITLDLPEETGRLISTGTTLILNGGTANGFK